MTQPDIQLSTSEVRRHGSVIDDVAVLYREAADAAAHVDMHDEVYGVLCSPMFLPLIKGLETLTSWEIARAAKATSHLAELMRILADSIDRTDAAAAERIQGAAR